MRLINTKTLELEEFLDEKVPRYAILSHRWQSGKNGEATLQGFKRFLVTEEAAVWRETAANSGSGASSPAFSRRSSDDEGEERGMDATLSGPWEPQLWNEETRDSGSRSLDVDLGIKKVLGFLDNARELGFHWGWSDTVCIDKTNNAELSEAINSMYRWYQNSDICLVYLNIKNNATTDINEIFKSSDWLNRGWTLQELLAPRVVLFFDATWHSLGSKESLKDTLSALTRIPAEVLSRPRLLRRYSAAQRMSWAANRTTTRSEDIAYCLLGLFDVNMELLYGEGGVKAFRRLQIKILEEAYDESLFVWNLTEEDVSARAGMYVTSPELEVRKLVNVCSLTGLLATRPRQFATSGRVELEGSYTPSSPVRNSSWGVELTREMRELKNVSVQQQSMTNEWGSQQLSSAKVLSIPLSCRPATGEGTCARILIAEDFSSLPLRRWCRVIVSGKWGGDVETLEEEGDEKKELVEEEKHLFVRISWPEQSTGLSRSRSGKANDGGESNRRVGRRQRPLLKGGQ